jgi:hypothetical protein
MADRYDPRLSVRPIGDRRLAQGSQQGQGDPLAELARIVSGRGNTAPALRTSTAPAPATEAAPLDDLEAELISNLQASFTTVNENPPAPRTADPQPKQPAPPAPPPGQAPRASEGIVRDRLTDALAALAPVIKFERPQEAQPASGSVTPFPGTAQSSGSAGGQPMMAPATVTRLREALNSLSAAPQPIPSAEGGFARVEERAALRPLSPAPLEPTSPPAVADRQPARMAVPERIEPNVPSGNGHAEVRGRPPHPRWEKPAEPRSRPGSRFAPPPVAAAQQGVEDDDELFPAPAFAEEEAVPVFAEDTEPSADELELQDELQGDRDYATYVRHRTRRRRLLTGAAAVVLLAGGGIAVAMLRGGPEAGLPPIITADSGPSKVTPVSPAPEADPSKLIYDRVGSADTAGTTLVKPPTQVASIPASPAPESNPIANVIESAGGGTLAGGALPDDLTNEPRRVRTVVVRPDGTIVSNESTPAETTATLAPVLAAPQAPLAPVAAPDPTPPVTVGQTPTSTAPPTPGVRQAVANPVIPAPAAPRPSSNETLNVAGAGAGNAPNGELVITPNGNLPAAGTPAPGTTTVAANTPRPVTPAAPATPRPASSPGAGPATTGSVASLPSGRASGPAGTAPAAGATLPGGTMVQVSSQRTEEGARATFKDLQAHYASILGTYPVDIQRADLGSRGVFYRARVGPFAAADARRLCDDLKAAGGDCILVSSN